MNHTSKRNRTIEQFRQDLAEGTETVLDLCSYYSDRISAEEIDGAELNAVLALNPMLRKEAEEVDADGIDSGLPLAGVSYSHQRQHPYGRRSSDHLRVPGSRELGAWRGCASGQRPTGGRCPDSGQG